MLNYISNHSLVWSYSNRSKLFETFVQFPILILYRTDWETTFSINRTGINSSCLTNHGQATEKCSPKTGRISFLKECNVSGECWLKISLAPQTLVGELAISYNSKFPSDVIKIMFIVLMGLFILSMLESLHSLIANFNFKVSTLGTDLFIISSWGFESADSFCE